MSEHPKEPSLAEMAAQLDGVWRGLRGNTRLLSEGIEDGVLEDPFFRRELRTLTEQKRVLGHAHDLLLRLIPFEQEVLRLLGRSRS